MEKWREREKRWEGRREGIGRVEKVEGEKRRGDEQGGGGREVEEMGKGGRGMRRGGTRGEKDGRGRKRGRKRVQEGE